MTRHLLLASCLLLAPLAALADPIAIQSKPVPFNATDANDRRLGPLVFLDGLELSSSDRRFGGYSAMAVEGGQLLLLSDTGHWLTASLVLGSDGQLTGLDLAELLPLLDLKGQPVADKVSGDGESLARLADGSLLVGFEQNGRIWHYASPTAPAEAWPQPPALDGRNGNSGLEALTAWPGGLLGILEGSDEYDATMGFTWDGSAYQDLVWPLSDGFRVTDATLIPGTDGVGGDLLVLERFYTPAEGVKARLQFLDAGSMAPGAFLEPQLWGVIELPRTVDNFEALAMVREASGRTLLYLLSDDNQNPLQRTLLLRFELAYE